MRLLPIAAFLLLAAAPAGAVPDWRAAPEHDVLLTTWDIQPPETRLKAGEAVRLRLVNNSERRLTFSAPGLLRGAKLRSRDRALAETGRIEVPPLSTRTILLVPSAGRYKVSGGDFVRRLLGMRARIVVE